jgi:hypothetical protein
MQEIGVVPISSASPYNGGMKCDQCGKESPGADFEQQSRVGGGSRYFVGLPQEPMTYWICRDCANYRRGTFRLLYWMVGLLLALGLFGVVVRLFN